MSRPRRDTRSPALRSRLVALGMGLLVVLGLASPATAVVAAAPPPKIVIIVGATGSMTQTYRQYADTAAAEALQVTPNVVKVYSPNATWDAVRGAIQGANVVVY